MAKYIVNPILVKMKESAEGSIYQSIVAMGFRARQINDDIRYELRYRMQDIVPVLDETEKANPDQLSISREFEKLPKPTFIAMKEIYERKLKFSYTLEDAELQSSELTPSELSESESV
jgi:DNA-directed RNA polymerase subunit K/omega